VKTHILVVKDETQIARVLKMELESEGETNLIETTNKITSYFITRIMNA
jgi:DNA-binding response OmpR family regulator